MSRLILAALLLAAAAAFADALITREGVGGLEYVAGGALLGMLLATVGFLSRRRA